MMLPVFFYSYFDGIWVHSILPLALAAVSLLALARSKKKIFPGPRPLPLIGTRWQFWTRYRINEMHLAYQDMNARYGNIFAEWTDSGIPLVSICSRASVEKVLLHKSKMPFRPPTEIVQIYRRSRPDRYASTGLVNEQGENWLFLRTHLTHELTSLSTMTRFIPALNDICDDFTTLIRRVMNSDGVVENFDFLTNSMGLESSCALVMGARLGFLSDKPNPRAPKLAAAVKAHFTAQRDSYFGMPIWKYVPTTLYSKFKASEDCIHDIVTEIMSEASSEDAIDQNDGMRSVFNSILNNKELDQRDKLSGIIDFITAGIETLSHSVIFLIYLMSKRPDWQQKIRDELKLAKKCAADYGDAITAADLREIPSVRKAMMEGFRLLPTAPFLARLLDTPINLDGYVLPAGTFIFCQTMLACRKEENFYRAKEFLPERWHITKDCEMNAEHIETVHDQNDNRETFTPHSPHLVAPFGRGKRMCPGKRFIELELQMLLVKLVEKFEIQLVDELELNFDFLLAPKTPVRFRFVPIENDDTSQR